MNSSEKFYDRLTFLYPAIDLFLRPQKQKFFRYINTFPHGRLLEIGVGNGSHFKYYTSMKSRVLIHRKACLITLPDTSHLILNYIT